MKRLNLTSPLVLLSGLFFVMFMISCGKDGAKGADGAPGPAGPKGDSGSGNVIYSAWLDVAYKPDTVHQAGGKIDTIGYYAIIAAPKLTQALVSTADVKVFINGNDASDPVIYALPYVATSGLNIRFSAYTGNIQLDANADVSTVTTGGKKYQQYRYMIVPGNNLARAAAPVNWSDYAAVKAYLGLKD
ncbi:hypothetical protein A4D02_33460 [Niastella koreensis]|uniref:Collagen-like protein n=2 Tax=Niastella koreensis TaxID=354356 RepID=G8T9D0_NIAKG|nr:collagen-like protein [Niastella koreensis]AEV98098.1 hypothetical protein Niako_1735 [Niastella koreensis GR20-10]OQP45310.1 hypothetical protein A4D02_33460 [Niastella koreensis]